MGGATIGAGGTWGQCSVTNVLFHLPPGVQNVGSVCPPTFRTVASPLAEMTFKFIQDYRRSRGSIDRVLTFHHTCGYCFQELLAECRDFLPPCLTSRVELRQFVLHQTSSEFAELSGVIADE